MAIIQSGATTDLWTIDPTSKAGRVTLYDSSGNEVTAGPTAQTASWTSGTAQNTTTTAMNITGLGTVSVSIHFSGSITAGSITFEASHDGGSNYESFDMIRTSSVASESSYTLVSASGDKDWQGAVAGMTHFRVKLDTVITGAGTLSVRVRGSLVSISQSVVGLAGTTSGKYADFTAKATQAAAGLGVQDLKDAGRVIQVFSQTLTSASATTEILVTLTPITDGTAGSTGTSFTVTSGKRLRLQSMVCSLHLTASTASAVGMTFFLLQSASGAVTTSSPHIALVSVNHTGAQVAQSAPAAASSVVFPDGIELSGTMQLGISQRGVTGATFLGSVYLIGYEY